MDPCHCGKRTLFLSLRILAKSRDPALLPIQLALQPITAFYHIVSIHDDGHFDLIPFFGPPMVREAVARQIVDVPVLVSDIRDCCVVVVHYNAAAIVQ